MGGEWPAADEESEESRRFDWRMALSNRAQWLVVVIVAVAVAGLLGRLHWSLELFSHFVAWYALGAFLAALVFWICGSFRWAAGTACLALLLALQPLSWYWPANTVDGDGPACRILLANVLTSNNDHQALLDLIQAENPDVICVHEVNDAWNDALRPLRETYPSHHAVPRGDNFGIALFSRVSPGLPATLFEGELGVPALAVPIDIGGRRAELLTIHTLPPIRARLARRRNQQLAAASTWFNEQTNPAIVAGDLNMTMYSPIYRDWMDSMKAHNARRGYGPLGTWPLFVPFLRLPLDHALVSPEIGVRDCRLGPDIGSDHRPLIVDLALPSGKHTRP